MSLSEKIATLRKQKGWTQEYLAEKVGVKKTQVTRWETARMRPSLRMVKAIASVFGVTAEILMASSDSTPVKADSELQLRMNQLQELDPGDQTLVFRIIDTFAKQKRLAQVFVSQGS